jgi:predicted dehydrogenase
MTDERNILVVGAGYWGRRVITEYLNLLDDSDYDNLYVYDAFLDKTKLNNNRISLVNSLDQAYKKVELAHVCTPNSTHYTIVKELISNGIETLVEKPLTENYKEANDLIHLSRDMKTQVFVGMLYRYSDAINKAKSILNEQIVNPHIIFGSWLHNIGIPNIRRVMEQRDVVWDIFIHLVDIVYYLFDELPTFFYSRGIKNQGSLNHSFQSDGSMKQGLVYLRSSFISHMKERRIEIIGENENLNIDFLDNILTLGADEHKEVYSFYDNPLQSELRHFLDKKSSGRMRNAGNIGLEETALLENILTTFFDKTKAVQLH